MTSAAVNVTVADADAGDEDDDDDAHAMDSTIAPPSSNVTEGDMLPAAVVDVDCGLHTHAAQVFASTACEGEREKSTLANLCDTTVT